MPDGLDGSHGSHGSHGSQVSAFQGNANGRHAVLRRRMVAAMEARLRNGEQTVLLNELVSDMVALDRRLDVTPRRLGQLLGQWGEVEVIADPVRPQFRSGHMTTGTRVRLAPTPAVR